MESTEFDAACQKLRTAIRDAVAAALAEFEKTTGVTPSGISIKMEETTTMNSEHPTFVLGNVRFRFER